MYTDMDSILFANDGREKSSVTRWSSSVEHRELSSEDLYALYGCWADDAVRAGFLAPVRTAC